MKLFARVRNIFTGFIYPIQGSWSWAVASYQRLDSVTSRIRYRPHVRRGGALAGVIVPARVKENGANGEINAIPGANAPLATLGTFILWLGWFGFNGGSELMVSNVDESNAVAQVFEHQHGRCWCDSGSDRRQNNVWEADLSMALNGALAGLVSITAEPLAPSAEFATVIGALGGAHCLLNPTLDRMKIDDQVGAISVHGVAGIWGLFAVPVEW